MVEGSVQELNIVLEDNNELDEVVIYQNGRDKAKEIMRKVRDKRKDYLDAVNKFSCETYFKAFVEREDLKFHEPDSLETASKTKTITAKKRKRYL